MIIFSILAFVTLFISICIRDRNNSLKVQSINCLFESLYAFSINAYTGAVLGFINFVRSCMFRKKELFKPNAYLFLLVFFEMIVIINCLITWNGIISLLPTVASIVRTYCLWQSQMKYVRMSGIISGILFGMYYMYYLSWFMVTGYFILFVISLYNVCKIDLKSFNQALKQT